MKEPRPLKRYLVFAGEFYPRSGLGDLVGDFDTTEEAEALRDAEFKRHSSRYGSWVSVWDSWTREKI